MRPTAFVSTFVLALALTGASGAQGRDPKHAQKKPPPTTIEQDVREAKDTANKALQKVDDAVHEVYRGITAPPKKKSKN